MHLLDGHDTVVDTDDDAGKVRVGEYGDGYLESGVDAGDRKDDDEEEDGARHRGQPERRLARLSAGFLDCDLSHFSSASFPLSLPAASGALSLPAVSSALSLPPA